MAYQVIIRPYDFADITVELTSGDTWRSIEPNGEETLHGVVRSGEDVEPGSYELVIELW